MGRVQWGDLKRLVGKGDEALSACINTLLEVVEQDVAHLESLITFGCRGDQVTIVEADEKVFRKWAVIDASGHMRHYWFVCVIVTTRGRLREIVLRVVGVVEGNSEYRLTPSLRVDVWQALSRELFEDDANIGLMTGEAHPYRQVDHQGIGKVSRQL